MKSLLPASACSSGAGSRVRDRRIVAMVVLALTPLNAAHRFLVFGYGSLVWKAEADFEAPRPATLRGWARRFWQGSPDHRGTAEKPGRVVTVLPADDPLIAREEADGSGSHEVHGTLWRVPPHRAADVLRDLDVREKAGYARTFVDCVDGDVEGGGAGDSGNGEVVHRALLFTALSGNAHFLGPPAGGTRELARHVLDCEGPSGRNEVYVRQLAKAMSDRGVLERDHHLHELILEMDRIQAEEGTKE